MSRFCPNCGTEVDDNAVFCPTCGQPIDQATETEMPPAPAWPEPSQPPPAGLTTRRHRDRSSGRHVECSRGCAPDLGRRGASTPTGPPARGCHASRSAAGGAGGGASRPRRAVRPGLEPAADDAGDALGLAYRRRGAAGRHRRRDRPVRRLAQPDRAHPAAGPARHRGDRLLLGERCRTSRPAPGDVSRRPDRLRHRARPARLRRRRASASCSSSSAPPRPRSVPSSSSSVATSRWAASR